MGNSCLAKEVGADVSYCPLKAAKVRNLRIQSAHKRLIRLGGLPLPRPFTQRLLLSRIWLHAFHAAETASVPKSVFKRLRTQAARAMSLRKKGTNPFLACLLPSPAIVDPQYVLLSNRVALFRQVLRELPEYKDLFTGQLVCPESRYKGPTRLLVRALRSRGWTLQQGALFEDSHGRTFHLFMTPLRHIRYLLATTWTTFVCPQVCHRKGLTGMQSIDRTVTKDLSSLRKEETRVWCCINKLGLFTRKSIVSIAVEVPIVPVVVCRAPDPTGWKNVGTCPASFCCFETPG